MKVSVIVPVYNTEKYLRKCLDSLVNQTLKDIEIIIVNDGSPDNSQEIIDEYKSKYPNVKAFVKENGGLSSARNFGIEKAMGEYIAFVDSDDYVSLDMYEKMYQKAIEGNFDMVVCDLNYVYPDKTVPAYSNIKEDTKDIKRAMISIYPAAWNKIFKKDLFQGELRFKNGVWFEDVEFIYRMLPRVSSIGTIHEFFNQYLQREGSITSTVNRKIYDYIYNWNGIVEYYKQKGLYEKYEKEIEYCYIRYLLATFVKQASRYSYEDYLEAVDTAIKNVKEHFPKRYNNPYFYKSLKGFYLLTFSKATAKVYYKLKKIH